ncbi:MAG: hypothetical protein OXG04_26115 [Acidobacteria bacterium]|nr:hypothetical protein [Acidobacteriota bacterium]
MTNETTLYENARIDAAIVNEVNEKEYQPFWLQAYASAIRRTRSISLLAGNGEPDLRETAALIGDNTALEALVHSGAIRTRKTEREQDSRANQNWLETEWRPMDYNLRNQIAERIPRAAETSLTVTDTTGAAGAQTIGERQGAWLHDGRILWDISQLPARARAAIEDAVDEMYPKASQSAQLGFHMNSARRTRESWRSKTGNRGQRGH